VAPKDRRAVSAPDPRAPIALAERIFELLDHGRFTVTYKYAVSLALLASASRTSPATTRRPTS
jgi:hypothetical protein